MSRALAFSLSLWVCGVAAAESPGDRVYARFGDVEVTVGDIEAAIAKQAPAVRRRYRDPEKLEELAMEIVRSELFAWEARRRGLDRSFRIRHERDRNAVQLFLRETIDEKLDAQPITDGEIRAYYDENRHLFESPASARAAHVLVSERERAEALVKEVEGMSVRQFRELTRKESLDERTKLSGGDLRFFDAEGRAIGQRDVEVHPAIAEAAFELQKPGDVYPEPVEVDGNFSVIVLRAKREARVTGVPAARERIRATLQQTRRKEALEALVSRLYAAHEPELTDALLAEIEIPTKAETGTLGHGH